MLVDLPDNVRCFEPFHRLKVPALHVADDRIGQMTVEHYPRPARVELEYRDIILISEQRIQDIALGFGQKFEYVFHSILGNGLKKAVGDAGFGVNGFQKTVPGVLYRISLHVGPVAVGQCDGFGQVSLKLQLNTLHHKIGVSGR